MSSSLPSPNDDYTAPERMALNEAAWNAVFNSIGERIRALEAVRVEWEALIALGTGQALEVISANVAPNLAAANAALATLQADVAAAEDIVAQIVSGSVPISTIAGLSAALANKASLADLSSAIAALVGAAPAQLDTISELATALGGDANLAATLTAALAVRLRFDAAQGLSIEQKAQALENLGVGSIATRALTISPDAPAGGADGDIWIQV